MKLSQRINNLRRELVNEYLINEHFQQQFIELQEMASEFENQSLSKNVVCISDFQRNLRRDFNLNSSAFGNHERAILSLKISGVEIEIPITSKMTYRTLKEEIVNKLLENTEAAKQAEFLIYSLKKSYL